jgi:hypothetical protein
VNWTDHDHRGEYADAGHDHYDYAERHHRHYDLESEIAGLREDLGRALERIRELEDRAEPEESPLARRDAYIGTWSGQDVTRREADR